MNQYQVVTAVMAASDIGAVPRDAEGRRRQYTAAELDALAAFNVPGAGAARRLAAGVAALRSRATRRGSERTEPVLTPCAEAAARA